MHRCRHYRLEQLIANHVSAVDAIGSFRLLGTFIEQIALKAVRLNMKFGIARLKNPVQEYAWGSKTVIAKLLGEPAPSAQPQAELWMGAHPKAPSQVLQGDRWIPLLKWIEDSPEEILGPRVAKRFSNKLPFLFKVLAADMPLSIQAHPDLEQAGMGFAFENEMEIPLQASHRNYRDDNHKPELICALTSFWCLNGFRKIEGILELVRKINNTDLTALSGCLNEKPGNRALQNFFTRLMTMDKELQRKLVEKVMGSVEQLAEQETIFQWMSHLHQSYPSDIGVLSPLFLNLVQLQPGEALYIPARTLHSYISGAGIELMANSDNVLRGGLTSKHVDVPELLKSLRFVEQTTKLPAPKILSTSETLYPTDADEFMLSVIRLNPNTRFMSARERSVEIFICTEGHVAIIDADSAGVVELKMGGSAIVPAAVRHYSMEGQATLFRASVPLERM